MALLSSLKIVYNGQMQEENTSFTITENDLGRRIDRILRKFLPDLPLSFIYSALRQGKIKINGKKTKPSYLAQKGDMLYITAHFNKKEKKEAAPPLHNIQKPEVLLQTDDLIFINKPKGQTVHGEKSLCQAVLHYFPPEKQSLSFTPGPLHRLDKNTTGIIAFSQSLQGAQEFSKALRENRIGKYYLGIAEGVRIQPVLKSVIDGKECTCLTRVLTASENHNLALVLFTLITGKKHQIRLQCGLFKTPLLNDKKYGSKEKMKGTRHYFLHALKLKFEKPFLSGLPEEITAPLPDAFASAVKQIFKTEPAAVLNSL